MSAYLLSFGARLRIWCLLRHFSPRGPSRSHFIRSFALAIVHCHRKTYIINCFFCNSCFSQYDTRYVCEKLIDKILSVSRETQYFSVFFLRAFGKFSCGIRIKTGFLLFGSMRGVCLYFVAQCAFVPTRTVLAKCFSARLLISMVCSAVFLGLIGWIIDRRCRPVCFFSWRAYSNRSRAYLPSDRTAPRDSRRWCVLALSYYVFVCIRFCLFCCGWRAPHRSCLGLLVWRIPF